MSSFLIRGETIVESSRSLLHLHRKNRNTNNFQSKRSRIGGKAHDKPSSITPSPVDPNDPVAQKNSAAHVCEGRRWKVTLRGTNESGYTLIFSNNIWPTKVELAFFEKEEGPGGRAWHASNVEDVLGRIYHPEFRLRKFTFAGGSYLMPEPTGPYLEREFGLGWELLAANLMYKTPKSGDSKGLDLAAKRQGVVREKTHPECLRVSSVAHVMM